MLIEFTVGNYRSFKEPQTISFQAIKRLKELPKNTIQSKQIPLLKAMALYGPNGGGKSNLIKAMFTMREIVRNSLKYNSDDELPVEPFALNPDTPNQPTLFEVVFYAGDSLCTYGFEATRAAITKEYLSVGEQPEVFVFKRNGRDIELGADLANQAVFLIPFVKDNSLFLSVLDSFNIAEVKPAWELFSKLEIIHGLNPAKDLRYTIQMLKTEEDKRFLMQLLYQLDLSFEDLTLVQSLGENIQNKNLSFDIYSTHAVFNEKGKKIGKKQFDIQKMESHGTQHLIAMAGLFLNVLAKNRILVYDELDASLHPYQIFNIIRMFSKFNEGEAQFLFSTHNTSILSKDLLRRDQIYFVEKNERAASKLTLLSSFRNNDGKVIRNDLAIEKAYLAGQFSGVPIFKFATWPEELEKRLQIEKKEQYIES